MGEARGHPLIGQLLQETYRVERLLGEGGMGAVYEASHKRLPRRFAIKVLSPAILDFPEAVARFKREAEIASGLGHPHIIEVVDFNETPEGIPYIVMELLDGEDLAAVIKRCGRLELARALELVEQVGSALQAAHQRGVIHRDLKPSNIFLCRPAEATAQRDVVKVVDFGISKVVGSTSVVTQAQTTMGTPCYMSPEQAEGRSAEVDARTDIFSLGTILYEMLAGEVPFTADTIPAVLYRVVHHEPPDLRARRPDVPAAVAAVVARAMRKAPDERFASVAELLAALRAPRTPQDDDAAAATPQAAIAATIPAAAAEAAGVSETLPAPSHPVVPATTPPAAAAAPTPAPAPVGTGPTTLSATAAELVDAPETVALPRGLLQGRGRLVVLGGLTALSVVGYLTFRAFTHGGSQPVAADASAALGAAGPADLGVATADARPAAAAAADAGPADAAPRAHRITVRSTDAPFACLLRVGGATQTAATTPCSFSAPHGVRVTLQLAAAGRKPVIRKLRVLKDLDLRFALDRETPRHAGPAPAKAVSPHKAVAPHKAVKPREKAPPKKDDWGMGKPGQGTW